MPSLSRKRGAPPDSNATTPIKRVRRANRESHESSPDGSDIEPRTERNLVQDTNKKVTKSKRAKVAPLPGGTNERGRTGSATQEVKQEVENNDIAITKTPKKGGSRVKTQTASAKEEQREEEGVAAVQSTPKKARKRKVANEEEAEQAHDEPTPKKVKGKRKTKEEKEAEAMPLAARSTGLRMFIGAHVSGAKGGSSRPAVVCT